MTRHLVLACAVLIAAAVQAQPTSAPSASEIPMADYLALLAQIAPAAREGTEAYLQAFQQRCGRTLTTAELRRAMSEGNGDPVLMALIRASQLRNAKALAELGQRLECGARR
jgi:hypothetical protein